MLSSSLVPSDHICLIASGSRKSNIMANGYSRNSRAEMDVCLPILKYSCTLSGNISGVLRMSFSKFVLGCRSKPNDAAMPIHKKYDKSHMFLSLPKGKEKARGIWRDTRRYFPFTNVRSTLKSLSRRARSAQ